MVEKEEIVQDEAQANSACVIQCMSKSLSVVPGGMNVCIAYLWMELNTKTTEIHSEESPQGLHVYHCGTAKIKHRILEPKDCGIT